MDLNSSNDVIINLNEKIDLLSEALVLLESRLDVLEQAAKDHDWRLGK